MTLDQERARFLATLEEARQTQEIWEQVNAAWERNLQMVRDLNTSLKEAIRPCECEA